MMISKSLSSWVQGCFGNTKYLAVSLLPISNSLCCGHFSSWIVLGCNWVSDHLQALHAMLFLMTNCFLDLAFHYIDICPACSILIVPICDPCHSFIHQMVFIPPYNVLRLLQSLHSPPTYLCRLSTKSNTFHETSLSNVCHNMSMQICWKKSDLETGRGQADWGQYFASRSRTS